jgi:ssDNA-binding Zn-finger/Zn-ribbon topoisomerase 1
MTLRKVNTPIDPDDERRHEDVPAIKTCPMCEGTMELVYNRNGQQVVVCADCHTGVTVPATAWNIARIKREAKWMPKP